jgi:hypothetical protein
MVGLWEVLVLCLVREWAGVERERDCGGGSRESGQERVWPLSVRVVRVKVEGGEVEDAMLRVQKYPGSSKGSRG